MKIDHTNSTIKIGRWERLKGLFDLCIGIVFAAGILTFSKDRIIFAFTTDGMAMFPIPQLSIILLIETIILIFLWIKAVSGEMQMLRDYFLEFIPALPKEYFPSAINIAIFLGFLGYFSNRILVYSSIFVFFKLFEIWGLWIRDSKIKEMLIQAQNKSNNSRRQAWDIIEYHYLKRPQVQLAITILFFSFISVILSIYGELLPQSQLKLWLSSAAYGVMVLTIASNEVIYKIWRRRRNDALGEYYS